MASTSRRSADDSYRLLGRPRCCDANPPRPFCSYTRRRRRTCRLVTPSILPASPCVSRRSIGFPLALSVGFGLPLWKSGYVASEPHYDVDLAGELSDYGGLTSGTRIPAFFIDAQTRAGMSGSPVFARYHGPLDMRDPYREIDPDEPGFWQRDDVALWGSQSTKFVGCYSGRAGAKESEAAFVLPQGSWTVV